MTARFDWDDCCDLVARPEPWKALVISGRRFVMVSRFYGPGCRPRTAPTARPEESGPDLRCRLISGELAMLTDSTRGGGFKLGFVVIYLLLKCENNILKHTNPQGKLSRCDTNPRTTLLNLVTEEKLGY